MHTKRQLLWHSIVNSRALAGVGVVALLLIGGFGITRVASAQSVNYLIPVNTVNLMQQQIRDLTNRVTSLETQMRIVQNAPRATIVPINTNPVVTAGPMYTYPTAQTTYAAPTAPPRPVVIDQNGGSFVAGFDIYITGRGFTPNEEVLITRNGFMVGQVMVDGGGNFSSNGILLPLGPSTFTFTGQTSGISAVATVQGVTSVTQ